MAEYLKVNYNGLSKNIPTKETLDALTTEFNSLKAIYGVNSLNAPNASYTIQPYSNQTGYVGTASKAFYGGYFKYLDVNGVSIASGDIVPKTADTGEIGYGSHRWKDIYTNNINAHHIIVNTIARYYTKSDATPFLNIFAHPSEDDSDTNAYGTAVQLVTYYKPSGAAKIPHYLRFAASSATNCALTYSKNGQTGDTISIGTSAAPFDNIFGTNIIASSIVRPSTSSGASLGSTSYLWNNLYVSTINLNSSLVPIVANGASVGNSSKYMNLGYFTNLYNRGSTGANNRIPIIKYSTAAPSSTTGYTTGDIWVQYES